MSNELTKDNMAFLEDCLHRLRKLYDYNTNSNECDIIANTMADIIISGFGELSKAIAHISKSREEDTPITRLSLNEHIMLISLKLIEGDVNTADFKLTPLFAQINKCMYALTNYDRKKIDIPMQLSIALSNTGEKEHWLKTTCSLSVMVGRLCKDLVQINKILELDYYTVPTFLASVIFTEIGICTEEIEMFGTEPVDTGDLPSKTNRSTLCQLGIITPIVYRNEQGYYALTYLGYTTLETMNRMKGGQSV